MDMYIARQPIFTVHKKLFAYELLYRGTESTPLHHVSGNRATTRLLSSSFLTEGIDVISAGKPCFINFTEDLILKNIPLSFPKSQIVIEVLEDVKPTKDVIKACRNFVREGYTLALDDFIYDRSFEPLIELAQIIKIDVRLTPLDTIFKTLRKLSRFQVKLLAEKVECIDEFEKANKLGFHYYQGYFFNKPEKIHIKELTAVKLNLLNLMAEVTKKSTTMEKLHKIISVDIAISYKLLRFLNSAYFYRLQKVKTVRHAIAYLGEKELRRFILLAIVSELATNKPNELIRFSLVRAKFCELLALSSRYKEIADEIFLMGLFSFIDTMLDSNMSNVMDKLPLQDKVKEALSQGTGPCAPFLHAVISYERRQKEAFVTMAQTLEVDLSTIPEMYLTATKYANGLM
jgi:c-di-GMP-related signal transduction protein